MASQRVVSPSSEGGEARPWAEDALDFVPSDVVVVDAEARVVCANAAAKRLATSLAPALVARALSGEEAREGDVVARPLRDAAGRIRGAVVIANTRERAQAHARLDDGERQKKAILDNIPDIAWLKDRDGRFLAVNQPFAEAAGKAPEEVVGMTDLDLWPRDLAERYRADDAEVMKSGRRKRVEEPLVDARGRTSWIETVKTPITSVGGDVIGTTGIARDITERKRAEAALRTLNEELERRVAETQETLVRRERLAVLGQLAGGVAHQIRNPLAAIMNATYVLKHHLPGALHANVEDAIRIIHDEVRHANVIITGLLDHARVRAPDRQPTSIVDLVDKALVSANVPENVTIERAVEPAPLLDVDPDQLHGAFYNLARNAVEAMPNGGVLRVEVRVDGGHVLVAFTDTGEGIAPPVRGHLFEPLHSTKPLGIGLGLVTARTFVEAHGGRIAIADLPIGARFEVRLPAPTG